MGGGATAEAVAQTKVYACQKSLLYEPVPELHNDHFGVSVSFHGDFNGDGQSDLLIGGFNNPTSVQQQGLEPPEDLPGSALSRAFLFLGTATSPSTTPALTFDGNGIRDQFGVHVAFLNDMTGDGRDELLVSAPNWPDQFTRTGRVYVFFGRADGTYAPGTSLVADVDADIIIEGSVVGGRFGDALATTRLLDADNATDFLVGAPGTGYVPAAARPYPGKVYEFFGTGGDMLGAIAWVLGEPQTQPPFLLDAESAADKVLVGEADDDRFGQSLAIIGNIDAQTGVEFAVGAPQIKLETGAPREATGPGYVRVFNYLSDNAAFLHQFDGTQFTGPAGGEAFGYAIAGGVDIGGGDLTNPLDGINDILIGAILYDADFGSADPIEDVGAVHAFSGASFARLLPGTGGEATLLRGEFQGNWFGFSIAGMPSKVGNPAFPDIVVGAARYGDARVTNVTCVPVPATSGGCTGSQAGAVAGGVYLIDGATTTGQAAYLLIGERFKDSLGFTVAAGSFDSNGIAIVCGGPRWSTPCDQPTDCEPQTDPCPTETGRVYVFFADQLVLY